MLTQVQAVKALGALTTYFPEANLPEPTIRAWAAEIAMFDARDVVAGIVSLGRTLARLRPTLAEVIDAATEAAEQRAEAELQAWRASHPQIGERASDRQFGDEVNQAGLAKARAILAGIGKNLDESDAGRADVG